MSVKKHATTLKKGKALLGQGQQTAQMAKQAKGLLQITDKVLVFYPAL
ncbi:hypothetical protein [Xenorhabdus stockiae]